MEIKEGMLVLINGKKSGIVERRVKTKKGLCWRIRIAGRAHGLIPKLCIYVPLKNMEKIIEPIILLPEGDRHMEPGEAFAIWGLFKKCQN